ncbi:MAG: GHKL domain-containing protein [Bacteroidales bacterium]|nr:MAG: GHKL domain-containing protein [Bacteroidales bacterium]
MIIRRFYISIIVRVILISLNSLVIVVALQNPTHFFTIGITCSLFVVQILLLIRYINRTNNDLLLFYESLVNQDSTNSLPINSRGNKELNKIFNAISQRISFLKIEKEVQYQYLKHVVDHLEIGLFAFASDGKVELVNRAALKLFQTSAINDINVLNAYHDGLSDTILNLSPDRQRIVRLTINNDPLNISVRAINFRLHDDMIRLVSFHDINDELNETELKSWEKLIRVLTHEIMNSISPINSLTTTLSRIYQSDDKPKSIAQLNENDIKDTISGLSIIDKRSKGLMEFVKKYRQIYSIPQPVKESFRVKEVFEGIRHLYINEYQKKGIDFIVKVFPENIELLADKAMIEQVLINLTKNAIESIDSNTDGVIEMIAFRNEMSHLTIQVKDNGKGIAPDVLDDIFVPFFTTKNNGSGIGLSLSRQIMQMHSGTIKVQSEEGKGSTFSMGF